MENLRNPLSKSIIIFVLVIAMVMGEVPQVAQAGGFYALSSVTIIYKNWDGTVLEQYTEKAPVIDGSYHGSTPVRPSDDLYYYTFSGWNEPGNNIDRVYIAKYTATLKDPNKREIIWKDYNGSELKKEHLDLNSMPSWKGDSPKREPDERNDYEFIGWSPAITAVTDRAAYTAQYRSIPAGYTVIWKNSDLSEMKKAENVAYDDIPAYDGATPSAASTAEYDYTFSYWQKTVSVKDRTITYTPKFTGVKRKYTITWIDSDEKETVLKTDSVDFGELPSYTGETPARASDIMYDYTFSGWTPAVAKVTGPATYTAAYTAEPRNDFTIVWKNWDGTVLETDKNVVYGKMPVYNSETPQRSSDVQNTYTFMGWVPELGEVTKDTTYTASYLPVSRSYSVTWKDWNGEELVTKELPWGVIPEYPFADPERNPDGQYRYIFSGWDPAVSSISGNAVYTAQYTSAPSKYTVKFMNEDGNTPMSGVAAQTVGYGEKAERPSDPVKDGWRFLDWIDADGAVFDFSKQLDGADPEIILRPSFGKLYTVEKDNAYAGGSGEGSVTWKGNDEITTSANIAAVKGDKITLTATPGEGYVLGCFSARQKIDDKYENISCTMTGKNEGEFIMPANDVIVTASFVTVEEQLDSLKDENDKKLFHIRSEQDLLLLSGWSKDHVEQGHMEGQTIQLDRDLNMAGLYFNGFSGTFKGNFNGCGHTISNVEVSAVATYKYSHPAFFWNLEGSVKDLTVTGSVEEQTGNKTGGLVGIMQSSATVSGCTAVMQADHALVCTQYGNSTISNCYYRGGDDNSGCGTRLYTITGGSSYKPKAETAVSVTGWTGIRHVIDGQTYFAAGSDVTLTLTAPETAGDYKLEGFTYGKNDSHYLAKNAQNTYTISSISGDLTISPDYKYQMGLEYEDGKYLIRSKEDLEAVARAVDTADGCSGMTFRLMNDIDFNGAAFSGIAVGTEDRFYGTFDGNGKTISNMVIAGNADNVGFIGDLPGTLKGLTLQNCTVINTDSSGKAGLLAGRC